MFQVVVFWIVKMEGRTDLWNVGSPPKHYTASQPRTLRSEISYPSAEEVRPKEWPVSASRFYPSGSLFITHPGLILLSWQQSSCTGYAINWASRHEGVLGEWRHSSTHSLTSALDGGECSDSRLGRFASRERVPCANWIQGWVGPRAGLDAVVKRNIHSSCRGSNPWSSSP
jgi:hypothetical protein